MKVKVSDRGIVIPKTYFVGIEEVEIRRENGLILIVPITDTDPVSKLGKNPVACGTPDASENHDRFLYNNV